jgi:histidyl-tRNA synthetase
MIQKPEGTQDLFGELADEWQYFQSGADFVFCETMYDQIELPTFEQAELFTRGIGESSDIVNKEMFSVFSGGNLTKLQNGEEIADKSKFALRPEGTASVVRAAIENNLISDTEQPYRAWYAGSMFRAERPQKGRLREFHQIGAECLGSDNAYFDAEMINLVLSIVVSYGISRDMVTVHLNTLGCKDCRPAWRNAVKEYIDAHSDEMCDTCVERAEKNPLRAFDCKNEHCKQIMQDAPKITDFLCVDCRTHFEKVKRLLNCSQIEYELDPTLVRGLDYYTRTVFECTVDAGLGAQNAIGGGGRYDNLVEELGGKPTPALGFALGFERCYLAKKAAGFVRDKEDGPNYFLIVTSDEARNFAEQYTMSPSSPTMIEMDFRPVKDGEPKYRSIKSQLRLANKLNAWSVIILGDEEMREQIATMKNLRTHEERKIPFSDLFDNAYMTELDLEAWEDEL